MKFSWRGSWSQNFFKSQQFQLERLGFGVNAFIQGSFIYTDTNGFGQMSKLFNVNLSKLTVIGSHVVLKARLSTTDSLIPRLAH